jgi:hypothetical protein
MDEHIINKRKNNRIQTTIKIAFLCDHFQYIGTVTNCSASGMCIDTPHYISPDCCIKILISLQEEELYLNASIKRTEKRVNLHNTIGVELLSPPADYFEFIRNLRPSL